MGEVISNTFLNIARDLKYLCLLVNIHNLVLTGKEFREASPFKKLIWFWISRLNVKVG